MACNSPFDGNAMTKPIKSPAVFGDKHDESRIGDFLSTRATLGRSSRR
jgi:hypothetical protein